VITLNPLSINISWRKDIQVFNQFSALEWGADTGHACSFLLENFMFQAP